MNKFVHSLLFRGVVAHLLLFVFLFIKDLDFFCANIYDFLIYYFTSLIILILVLGQPSRTLSRISDQLDHLIESDVSENGELSNLSDKVKILGKSISISRNNLESQRNQLDSILTYMVDGVIATVVREMSSSQTLQLKITSISPLKIFWTIPSQKF